MDRFPRLKQDYYGVKTPRMKIGSGELSASSILPADMKAAAKEIERRQRKSS